MSNHLPGLYMKHRVIYGIFLIVESVGGIVTTTPDDNVMTASTAVPGAVEWWHIALIGLLLSSFFLTIVPLLAPFILIGTGTVNRIIYILDE